MPSHLALTSAEPDAPDAPLPPLRQRLADTLAREKACDTKIEVAEATIRRLRERGAAVKVARDALAALEEAHAAALREWSGDPQGEPPVHDHAGIVAARKRVARAEQDAAETASAADALHVELQRLYRERGAAESDVTAIVRAIEGEEMQRLLDGLADVQRKRAALRAEVAGLMQRYFAAGVHGDGAAQKLAHEMRLRLAAAPPETTDAAVKAASTAWQNFADRLRSDPRAQFQLTKE